MRHCSYLMRWIKRSWPVLNVLCKWAWKAKMKATTTAWRGAEYWRTKRSDLTSAQAATAACTPNVMAQNSHLGWGLVQKVTVGACWCVCARTWTPQHRPTNRSCSQSGGPCHRTISDHRTIAWIIGPSDYRGIESSFDYHRTCIGLPDHGQWDLYNKYSVKPCEHRIIDHQTIMDCPTMRSRHVAPSNCRFPLCFVPKCELSRFSFLHVLSGSMGWSPDHRLDVINQVNWL